METFSGEPDPRASLKLTKLCIDLIADLTEIGLQWKLQLVGQGGTNIPLEKPSRRSQKDIFCLEIEIKIGQFELVCGQVEDWRSSQVDLTLVGST